MYDFHGYNVHGSRKHAKQKEKDVEFLSSADNEGEEASDKLSQNQLCDLTNIKSETISDYEMHAKLDQIIKSQDSLKIKMQNQGTLLQHFMGKTEISLNLLMQKVCEMVGEDEVSDQIFHNLLPLTTKVQVDELEDKIRVDLQYRRKLVRKLSTFGGVSGAKTIRNIAKCLFTDLLLTEFSWIGTGTKKNFNQYKNIFLTILDAVRERYPSYTDVEGSNFFKTYLKQARFRLGKTFDESADVDVTMDENSTKN